MVGCLLVLTYVCCVVVHQAMSSALAKTSEELVAENQALKAELDRVRMQLQVTT